MAERGESVEVNVSSMLLLLLADHIVKKDTVKEVRSIGPFKFVVEERRRLESIFNKANA